VWIRPFLNGSVFIDVDDNQGGYCTVYRSYPVYYLVYKNASQSSNEEDKEGDGKKKT